MRMQRLPTERKRSMVLARPARRVGVLLAWPLLMMQASLPPLQAAEIKAARNSLEQEIWNLLDDGQSVYVTLSESDFRALGAGFDLPDGGKAVTALAMQTPGGAFDSRDVAKIPSAELGYQADWIVERFRRYNLDWDIGALRLRGPRPQWFRRYWFQEPMELPGEVEIEVRATPLADYSDEPRGTQRFPLQVALDYVPR